MSAPSVLAAWGPPSVLAAWATVAALALATMSLTLRVGRRRSAINEAIHELRRPLQALALAGRSEAAAAQESAVRLAAAALERLEREVNGGTAPPRREAVPCRELVWAAVSRWRAGAAAEGADLSLDWRAPADVALVGDPVELGQALDNLIVNAIEHGGGQIVVAGMDRGERILISVADSGRGGRARLRGDAFSVAVERFSGRRRRGHGLAVVRRTAALYGGRFVLEHSAAGCRAVLELPHAGGHTAERSG